MWKARRKGVRYEISDKIGTGRRWGGGGEGEGAGKGDGDEEKGGNRETCSFQLTPLQQFPDPPLMFVGLLTIYG